MDYGDQNEPHDFNAQLEFSQSCADQPFWLEVYREAFPNIQAAVNVRQDGWAQRGGIDRVLTLSSGRTVYIDEKIRRRDWGDVLLEYWSNYEQRVPGWVAKDLACDFIAYAYLPSQLCLLLPALTLRRAWQNNRQDWTRQYKRIEAQNAAYRTISVAVPRQVLIDALGGAMQITWKLDV